MQTFKVQTKHHITVHKLGSATLFPKILACLQIQIQIQIQMQIKTQIQIHIQIQIKLSTFLPTILANKARLPTMLSCPQHWGLPTTLACPQYYLAHNTALRFCFAYTSQVPNLTCKSKWVGEPDKVRRSKVLHSQCSNYFQLLALPRYASHFQAFNIEQHGICAFLHWEEIMQIGMPQLQYSVCIVYIYVAV